MNCNCTRSRRRNAPSTARRSAPADAHRLRHSPPHPSAAGPSAIGPSTARPLRFYTVHDASDGDRVCLCNGPWSSDCTKSSLGVGVYCWATRDAAVCYANGKCPHAARDLYIITLETAAGDFGSPSCRRGLGPALRSAS
jgi:hypothetical protein